MPILAKRDFTLMLGYFFSGQMYAHLSNYYEKFYFLVLSI